MSLRSRGKKIVLRKNWIPSYQVPWMAPPTHVTDGKGGPA